MQRIIGGELPLKDVNYTSFLTDSGRSSLRLFLRQNRDKKILLPDFLCEIIVNVLKLENLEYDFYHINQDLSFDINEINQKDFDVLYVINYFGKKHSKLELNKNKIILEDNVFNLYFENIYKYENWFAYNSLRKISEIPDGSNIITNLNIENIILNKEAGFSNLKYIAKNEKYNYINNSLGDEKEYLDLFKKGENVIDNQKEIYAMSSKSLYLYQKFLLNYLKEQNERKNRFEFLYSHLKDYSLLKVNDIKEYSYFVLKIKNRDKIREELYKYKIFLPIHWPYFGIDNILYKKLLSIPLFSYYKMEDFQFLVSKLKGLL